MAQVKQIAVRLSDEDLALVEALRSKTGVWSTAEVVRMALRALAEREGVTLSKRRPKP